MTNRSAFAKWLQERIDSVGTLRDAAERAGVSHTTLLRGAQGGTLTLGTLEAISKWTGVSLGRLLKLYGEEIDVDLRTESVIARVLDRNPELSGTLDAAVELLDDDDMEEILRFIRFYVESKTRK